MAVTAQTQGFLGGVRIGGVLYTVRGNPQFRANRNLDVTGMIGTGYPYLFAEGVQTPTITMSIVGRQQASGNPFTNTFLNYFFGRYTLSGQVNAPVWETNVIVPAGGTDQAYTPGMNYATCLANAGIAFSDGETVTFMFGVKAESIRISTAKGQDIMIEATFVGTWYKQFRYGSGADAAALKNFEFTTTDCSAPLRFQNVSIANPYSENVFGFNLSWSNNHTPNMALNGTLFPVAQNAGMPNAGLSLTLQALDSIPGDLTSTAFAFQVSDLSTQTITNYTVFSAPRPVVYNPYDRSAPMGRVLRNYNYTLLGSCDTPNVNAASPVLVNTYGGWNV